MNSRNYGVITGRIAKGNRIFANADGSKKVKVTVAVPRNFGKKDDNGNYPTDFIVLDGFVKADKKDMGVFDYMTVGALVSIGYSIRSNNYQDKKTGEMVYSQVLAIENVELMAKGKATAQAVQPAVATQQG